MKIIYSSDSDSEESIRLINSIKKCKQDSRTLSLQDKDDALGVEANWCSTYLSKSGLLAQGECRKSKSQKRNTVIMFRDPATAEVKGGVFWSLCCFCCDFVLQVRGLNPR